MKRAVELAEFVRKVIVLRHPFPILRRSRFLTGEYNRGPRCEGCSLVVAGGHAILKTSNGRIRNAAASAC